MSTKLCDMTLHVILTDSGDALLWGLQDGIDIPGDKFRKLLFAWHQPSCYGTTLELQQAGELTMTVLPAEMVLPFFAEPNFMDILRWEGGNEATKGLLEAAPLLYREAKDGRYLPSYSSFRNGVLQWTWEAGSEGLKELDWDTLKGLDVLGEEMSGLRSAFSATVSTEHYADEAAASDLRREYPALFQGPPAAAASAAAFTEEEWLAALGWKPDTAPFRPALQLLEPDEEQYDWRLRLVLQDKSEGSALVPIRLAADGQAYGAWASDWSPYIRERSPGWAARLAARLPNGNSSGELFAEPLSDEAAWRFLTTDSRQLLSDGWNVMLPGWWEAASKRKPRLRAQVTSEAGGRGQSLFGLNALVNFDWRIAIGDADLNEAEFAELLSRKERLFRFRGEWVFLDPALLEQIRRFMESMNPEEGLSLQDVLQLHLLSELEQEKPLSSDPTTGEDAEDEEERIKLEVELNSHLLALLRQLGQPSELEELAVPAGLRAELRGYQREGFTWLSFLRKFGLGACLADDMGLGKTVQFITYLLHHKAESEYPALLICPTSVLGNWQKELARFAPDLKVLLHYGKGRLNGEALSPVLKDTDVVITSYTTALLDQESLKEIMWSSLCLDEAQNIKNAQNKQSTAIRSLKARHRIALTGTPIENRLSELWSIYDFLNPGYLGNQRGFQHRFANPIEKNHDEEQTVQLQKLVKPFMLRRKKNDPAIQLDLPDKLEMKVYINLTAEQGALYEQVVKDLMERMKNLEGIERKGAILAALTKLKQLCDHPVLLTKEAPLSEETLLSEEHREAFITGSAKLERLVAMVSELRDEGDSCLIFTQYVGMGRILADVLRTYRGEPVLYLNGSTPKAERDKMIDTFQAADGTGPGIFVLSLKAGGVGLNLTAANHVFHFDRWWNPAVENQATDRAYRMGQKRNVQVHKFISLGTLEEKIDEMLESKMSLSENVISTSESWITELSNEELGDLFALRQAW
ncbi:MULTISPECIES: DEAD/DEAH box helicase [unclassified Paenibacillus]|uniref:DEAD/DEAH box helicase n=1 Tax=unclassified Paenibacillus TaxID=185978 RepID=UPI001AEB3CB3|nr:MULTISPECIES: DEAD/DEAH box helicase [unclassified Paenibacillus]MBP1153992.1 SNF2 family DNA or RNA helicase [Paenibacillus sp. PvP091]MBP1170623.1 SNF2 family DNA or RNA helicase [Paenibacillus sp. PvR098]MBP2441651.1 SNF2 family DNA or RNA helicase [Paenibacillus sp. PvP052]